VAQYHGLTVPYLIINMFTYWEWQEIKGNKGTVIHNQIKQYPQKKKQ
jgi:hypothetical protein